VSREHSRIAPAEIGHGLERIKVYYFHWLKCPT
jgi:hypothetical protein